MQIRMRKGICLVVALAALASSAEGARIAKRKSGRSPCTVGLGLSLNFQKNPIDITTAAQKIKALGVKCVRLWHYQSDYLEALQQAGIDDVLVNVPTFELPKLAAGTSHAKTVVATLKPFHSKGMRFRVAVGNEPLASWEGGIGNAGLLLPGLENMHKVLGSNGMSDVTCTVAFFNGVMGVGYPPLAGAFVPKLEPTIAEVAKFIYKTGGEFVIHIYPFFAVVYDSTVPLDLALGKTRNTINGTEYRGLLHQQIVATRSALTRLDSRYAKMPLSIGECGWPSQGHWAATQESAGTFVRHVIDEVAYMDPYLRTLYLFEAFDEKLKSGQGHGGPGASTEDNFGIMYEDGTPKYRADFR